MINNLCVQMSRLFHQPDEPLLRADLQPAPEPVHECHRNRWAGREGSSVLHREQFYQRCVLEQTLMFDIETAGLMKKKNEKRPPVPFLSMKSSTHVA